jgi:hypothetical protein
VPTGSGGMPVRLSPARRARAVTETEDHPAGSVTQRAVPHRVGRPTSAARNDSTGYARASR